MVVRAAAHLDNLTMAAEILPWAFAVAGGVISVLLAVIGALLSRVLSRVDRMDAKLVALPLEVVTLRVQLDQAREEIRSLGAWRAQISGFLAKNHGFEERAG